MKIVILGYARAGKDTCAEMLREDFGLTFCSSSFFAAEKVVMPALARMGIHYSSIEACFQDRIHHRATWYNAIVDYNSGDLARLGREIFAQYDVYCGLRNRHELEAIKKAKLCDLVVWIDASARGVKPEDPTSCSVSAADADLVIFNHGSLEDLRRELSNVLAPRLREH